MDMTNTKTSANQNTALLELFRDTWGGSTRVAIHGLIGRGLVAHAGENLTYGPDASGRMTWLGCPYKLTDAGIAVATALVEFEIATEVAAYRARLLELGRRDLIAA